MLSACFLQSNYQIRMESTQTIASPKPKLNWWTAFWRGVLAWFRLTNELTIRVYHGYGHAGRYVIYGHVLSLGPMTRKHFSKSIWKNTAALMRLFIVRAPAGAPLPMRWAGGD